MIKWYVYDVSNLKQKQKGHLIAFSSKIIIIFLKPNTVLFSIKQIVMNRS